MKPPFDSAQGRQMNPPTPPKARGFGGQAQMISRRKEPPFDSAQGMRMNSDEHR